MAEAHSKSRQQAEIAFGNARSQFFARGQALEELDSIAQARNEKTLRLREARKERDEAELSTAPKTAGKKSTSKR